MTLIGMFPVQSPFAQSTDTGRSRSLALLLLPLLLGTTSAIAQDWREQGWQDQDRYDTRGDMWSRSSDWRADGAQLDEERWRPYAPDPLQREYGLGEAWVPPDPRRGGNPSGAASYGSGYPAQSGARNSHYGAAGYDAQRGRDFWRTEPRYRTDGEDPRTPADPWGRPQERAAVSAPNGRHPEDSGSASSAGAPGGAGRYTAIDPYGAEPRTGGYPGLGPLPGAEWPYGQGAMSGDTSAPTPERGSVWEQRQGIGDPGYVYRGDPPPLPDHRQPRYRQDSESDGTMPWPLVGGGVMPHTPGALYPHAAAGPGAPRERYPQYPYDGATASDRSGGLVLPGLGAMRFPGGVGGFPFWR
ncbi:MAG: hypothetical protein ACPGU7_05810 [Gammaproteobacteria bacterium]